MTTNPYRAAASKFGAPYEPGITRLRVLDRDGWTCKMEVCCYPDRAIDPDIPARRGGVIPDERGSVDHIVPLSAPDTSGHVWSNVRAAHRLCNREAFSPSKRSAKPG